MKRSAWKMLFLPTVASKRLRGAMRGGFLSSFSVPGAGMLTSDEVYCVGSAGTEAEGRRGLDAVAGQTGLGLLVEGEAAQVDRRCIVGSERHRTGHQTRIVAPVEAAPDALQESAFGNLVIEVGRLVELLVVVDAERQATCLGGGSGSGGLRREETCGHGRHLNVCAEVMELRHLHIDRIARDLRVMPVNREEDRVCCRARRSRRRCGCTSRCTRR